MCSAVANPVALLISPVNKYVQKIVNNHAVNLYVSILTTVRFLVSIIIRPCILGHECLDIL
jgi:hypothetical protein